MYLEEIGISAWNCVDAAQDRDYWRALVNAALNLPVQRDMELVSQLVSYQPLNILGKCNDRLINGEFVRNFWDILKSIKIGAWYGTVNPKAKSYFSKVHFQSHIKEVSNYCYMVKNKHWFKN